MKATAVSDLSASMRLSRFGQSTKSDMNKAGLEVASGRKSDLVNATSGDLSGLFAIEKNMARLDVRNAAMSTASARAEASQLNLEKIQSHVAEFGTKLIAAVDLGNQAQAFSVASSARSAFDSIVSAMNGQYGHHSLFAGAAVDGAAVINGQDMYDEIIALTAGAADSTAVIAAVDDYFFNPAGGFVNSAFLGDALDAPGVEVANGRVVEYSARADSDSLRQALRDVALVAVAQNSDHAGSDLDGMNIMRAAATSALVTVDDIIKLRENLGHVEDQLSAATAFNASEKNMFEMKRNSIIAADPYEAATRFQALQTQMEAVYLMTSRLSTMKLQNYLR